MDCVKGRVNPSNRTKLRLFSEAAGYCQRPICRKRLFSDDGGRDYHIAEMAHILGAKDGGPRGKAKMPLQDRAGYDNLILLCPNCHKEIDKSPKEFPVELLRSWKQTHKEEISIALGQEKFSSRGEARYYIEPFLRKNKTIFDTVGPDSNYHEKPEAEEASVWQRKMLSQILPNNLTMLRALDANKLHLRPDERRTAELFRQHVDDLMERHCSENQTAASRFPKAMLTILCDE